MGARKEIGTITYLLIGKTTYQAIDKPHFAILKAAYDFN
jgi:hypothetical protein